MLVLESEVFGAVQTEPEMLNGSARCVEAKEPASVQPHENFGTPRIGTLGNHDSGRTQRCISFDVRRGQNVAQNREQREEQNLNIEELRKQSRQQAIGNRQ